MWLRYKCTNLHPHKVGVAAGGAGVARGDKMAEYPPLHASDGQLVGLGGIDSAGAIHGAPER